MRHKEAKHRKPNISIDDMRFDNLQLTLLILLLIVNVSVYRRTPSVE